MSQEPAQEFSISHSQTENKEWGDAIGSISKIIEEGFERSDAASSGPQDPTSPTIADKTSIPELPPLPHDIAAPETFLPGTPWWHHALIGLGIAVVLAIVIFFIVRKLRKAKPEAISSTSPFDTADKKLQELKESTETEPVGKIATQSSLILRKCFGIVLREQVLFETGEEIKLRPNSFANAPETLRPDLIQLLESLGEAKYAPSQINAAQSEDWISQSSEILTKLRRRLREKAEEPQPSA